jgi:glycine/D-amino acid oxidase-like deaminating enzyme
MFATVDEVGRVIVRHRIDADFIKGGQVRVALNRAQAVRMRELVDRSRRLGLGERDLRALDAAELGQRLRVAGARCGTFSPHAARIHPGKLLSGLAGVVTDLGVSIYEGTPVTEVRPHEALTAAGRVRARWVVRATEGYTAGLRGLGRALAPINSSMIITAPLAASAWRQIGWEGGEVLGDGAHVYVYLQRTDDGRIAIGGRGVPYRFGSRTGGAGDTASTTVTGLREQLVAMFPAAAGVQVDHAWSGVLGVSRDWGMSVDAQPGSGLAWAGGYVGAGVAAANLAGRTLRDLLLARHSRLTEMPWVGRRPRRWEPEPLRWSGIRATYALYRRADRRERRSGRPSRLARCVDAATGRR